MTPLDRAAREGDWKACSLALVAAFEALPREEASSVASGLVADLSERVVRHKGRWTQFLERAEESLKLARTVDGPDRPVALTSAVKDIIAAIAMSARQGRPIEAVGGSPLSGLALSPSTHGLRGLRTRSDGAAEMQDAWMEVHYRLADLPELKESVGKGIYVPGPSFEFSKKAAEAGII